MSLYESLTVITNVECTSSHFNDDEYSPANSFQVPGEKGWVNKDEDVSDKSYSAILHSYLQIITFQTGMTTEEDGEKGMGSNE